MTVKAIPEAVIAQGRLWGLYGDTEARLMRMIRRSVPVPGVKHVRRFLDWELIFNQGELSGVARIDLSLISSARE